LAQARDWWLTNRDKAPDAFDDDIDELLARLEDASDVIGRPVRQDRAVRRVFLKRIRYHVYFQIVDDGARVLVLALWHGSRGSGPDL